MSMQSALRKSDVFQAVKSELDEAGIPFETVPGTKRPVVRFHLDGRPHNIPVALNPKSGHTVENARHQVRSIIRSSQITVDPATDIVSENVEIVRQPTLSPEHLREFEDGPRVHDLELGRTLGFKDPNSIRLVIKRNLLEIEQISVLRRIDLNSCKDDEGYWLSREQAVYVVMHSRTPAAKALQMTIASVFTAWAEGRLVPSTPALPLPQPDREIDLPAVVGHTSTPELLANDTAVDLIVDMVGLRLDEILPRVFKPMVNEMLAQSLPGILDAAMRPLLSEIARANIDKLRLLDASVCDRIDRLEAALEFAKDQIIASNGSRSLGQQDVVQEFPKPTLPWSSPVAADGRHDFDAVNGSYRYESPAVDAPVLPQEDLSKTDPLIGVVEVYPWYGLPEVGHFAGRMSLSQKIARDFMVRLAPHYPRIRTRDANDSMRLVYPQSAVRAWYEERGRTMIERHLAT